MTNTKKQRAKVTGITINLMDSNGNPRTVTIDPTVTKALFWDKKSVLEILGPFYEKHESKMTRKELTQLFGTIGKTIAGPGKKVRLNQDIVKTLWQEEGLNGELPAMFGKTLLCTLAPIGID